MRIAVFLGSRLGAGPQYQAAAHAWGRAMADRGIGLVYGGASIGLMSAVADGVLAGGGEVIGVMPRALSDREGLRTDLTTMHVVDTMHQRKALMADLSDAFVGLPGGLGTLEELFEIWTWAQLGYHAKPLGLLNISGFFDPLMGFVDHAVDQDFIKPADRDLVRIDDDPQRLLTWIVSEASKPDGKADDLSRT